MQIIFSCIFATHSFTIAYENNYFIAELLSLYINSPEGIYLSVVFYYLMACVENELGIEDYIVGSSFIVRWCC